jgi:hypothetical protein
MSFAGSQLRLFPPAKPLRDLFGREFFRSIPQCPGVYSMYDGSRKLLYVGESKNLRKRLSSYNQVQPGKSSRRLVRLVHQVRHIEWEVMDSKHSAVLKESELLASRRPKFNRASLYPNSAPFIGLRASSGKLELFLRRHVSSPFESVQSTHSEPGLFGPGFETDPAPDSIQWFGSFRGPALEAFFALGRACWRFLNGPCRWDQFSRTLMGQGRKRHLVFMEEEDQESLVELRVSLTKFLDGQDVGMFCPALEESRDPTGFEDQLLLADYETLTTFFEAGPSRNRQFRTRFEYPGCIRPDRLVMVKLAVSKS